MEPAEVVSKGVCGGVTAGERDGTGGRSKWLTIDRTRSRVIGERRDVVKGGAGVFREMSGGEAAKEMAGGGLRERIWGEEDVLHDAGLSKSSDRELHDGGYLIDHFLNTTLGIVQRTFLVRRCNRCIS